MERLGQGLQAEDVRARPIESEKNCDVGSEMLFELLDGGTGVRIVAVGDYMALVGAGDGFQNFGMYASIIVAGKVTGGLNWRRRHV